MKLIDFLFIIFLISFFVTCSFYFSISLVLFSMFSKANYKQSCSLFYSTPFLHSSLTSQFHSNLTVWKSRLCHFISLPCGFISSRLFLYKKKENIHENVITLKALRIYIENENYIEGVSIAGANRMTFVLQQFCPNVKPLIIKSLFSQDKIQHLKLQLLWVQPFGISRIKY